jgi:hypothetical protein
MTLKREPIDTGIFVGEEILVGPRTTKKEREYLKNLALSRFDVDARLAVINKEARDYLESVGERFVPHGVDNTKVPENIKGRDLACVPKKDHASNLAYHDAIMILNYVGMLRDSIQEGNLIQAVALALDLGVISVQFAVRPREKHAITGLRSDERVANMREARSNKLAVKHADVINLFNEISEHYESHERPSDREITKTVAEHLHMKFKTVESVLYRASKKAAK